MNKIVGSAAAIAIALISQGAKAADLPYSSYYKAPTLNSVYSWTGPYLGVNLGYQWGRTTHNSTRPAGPLGGITGGYNWHFGQFVVGGETDLQITGAEDVFAPWKFSNPWFGTLRGRAGYAYNNFLFYATGGLAYGTLRAESLGLLSENRSGFGWTVGAGVEVGFAPHWNAKIEYLYVDLADRAFSLTGANNGLESNLVRLGINYRF